MRIVCPGCAAAYEVPESRLAGRSAVRCARCGENWAPNTPAVPLPADDTPAAAEILPAEALPSATVPDAEPQAVPLAADPAPVVLAVEREKLHRPPQPPRSPGVSLPLAWAASLVVICACVAGLLAGHAAVARAWPPAQRLYAALGLPAD